MALRGSFNPVFTAQIAQVRRNGRVRDDPGWTPSARNTAGSSASDCSSYSIALRGSPTFAYATPKLV